MYAGMVIGEANNEEQVQDFRVSTPPKSCPGWNTNPASSPHA
jgi:hypothetical protein